MRIIPVIDLKSGVVVRGVGGRREEYRPVQSVLTADASPSAVARAFVERLGLRDIYVADLDAIAGAEPAWDIYKQLLSLPVNLWIDAGVASVRRMEELVSFEVRGRGLTNIIAGLESLPGLELLEQLHQAARPRRLVFSLDLLRGRPISRATALRDTAPEFIAATAIAQGVRAMIILDLAYVGMGQGVRVSEVCQKVASLHPQLELVSGGGVRCLADLVALRQAGCQAALVASALHDGRLTAEDLRTL